MLPKRMRRRTRNFAVASLITLGGFAARAQAPAAPDALSAPWTLQSRAALRERLGAGLYVVRRRLAPPSGVTSPPPPVLFGVAACMADGTLWTSAMLAEGLPVAPGVSASEGLGEALTVEPASGAPTELRVTLARVDPALGIAALRLVEVSGRGSTCGAGWSPGLAQETGGLLLGRVVYAAVPGDPRLRTVTVQGPGRDPFAWYRAAEGDPLPPGTPVFDAGGRWLGLAGPQAVDAPTRSHLLPDAATQAWLNEARPAEAPP